MFTHTAPHSAAAAPPHKPLRYVTPGSTILVALVVTAFVLTESAVISFGDNAFLVALIVAAIGVILALRRLFVPAIILWGLAIAFQACAPTALDLAVTTPDQLRAALAGRWLGEHIELNLNPNGIYSASGDAWDFSLGVAGTWWVDKNQLVLSHPSAASPAAVPPAPASAPVTCRLSLRKLSRFECDIQSLPPMYSPSQFQLSALTRDLTADSR